MATEPGIKKVPCESWDSRRAPPAAGLETGRDFLVVEEPIEYRIAGRPVATVMRTPGHDRELAVGFFFNEGWISGAADVGALSLCAAGGESDVGNVADLIPARGRAIDVDRPPRSGLVTASCGVCGKRTIEEVLAAVPPLPPGASGPASGRMAPTAVRGLPASLRPSQALFDRTGGLHAAGLFNLEGRLRLAREDVGRHNAVDKAVGALVLEGEIPFGGALLVSGRASFEIVQKDLRAGITVVAAISGVSSLARDLAHAGGITLIGFLRDASFKVYAHGERLRD